MKYYVHYFGSLNRYGRYGLFHNPLTKKNRLWPHEQCEQFINTSINVLQRFISLTHTHRDGHCFPLLLSIFHPCSSPVSGSHTLYGIDLLRKPHASRKIKFFSVTFDAFNTHYKITSILVIQSYSSQKLLCWWALIQQNVMEWWEREKRLEQQW